ncbi:hypothetical protein BN2475_630056 [Paraburkholderia ribeironis]|uniref:Uncharacterized protein n=1 Tax=Paraburkholderia ribeironis TaxID=1247936 RepID=A0A1N7SFP0_9BURK|nr:hypothetical protein BN2475_630056 [Paraburkholderia ribeironis]
MFGAHDYFGVQRVPRLGSSSVLGNRAYRPDSSARACLSRSLYLEDIGRRSRYGLDERAGRCFFVEALTCIHREHMLGNSLCFLACLVSFALILGTAATTRREAGSIHIGRSFSWRACIQRADATTA